jgi:peptidoglycan LD-endopeptidase LytH
MFFAHLPAGYLVGRVAAAHAPEIRGAGILTAAMAGGIFPDLDLLYLYLLDTTPQHHHTYWTHLPIAWFGVGLFAAVAVRYRSRAFRLGMLAFMLAWGSHLLMDTVTGDVWWLYPWIDQPFSLVKIEAQYQPWWMNFLLHWTILIELTILSAAAWLEIKSPRLFTRIRLAKPIAVFGLLLGALLLIEAYRPAPVLAQPVHGASSKDWNPESFWHSHWGSSGVHKGIDIFAKRGTLVRSSESGLVVYRGTVKQGGKVVLIVSPRGWFHYYAHLDHTQAQTGSWVEPDDTLGTVGSTGNAVGKPPHLHYAIFSPIPRPQSFRLVAQGWKRMFYRDPASLISSTNASQSARPLAAE